MFLHILKPLLSNIIRPIFGLDDLLVGALAGGLLGGAKHFAVDKPRENADRQLAAETARYSPWTGLKPQPVERANLFGSALSGVTGGMAAGQAFGKFGGGSVPGVGDVAGAGGGLGVDTSIAAPSMGGFNSIAPTESIAGGYGFNNGVTAPSLANPWGGLKKRPSLFG